MDAAVFPGGDVPEWDRAGFCECWRPMVMKTDIPDGSEVAWDLYLIEKQDNGQLRGKRVCSYAMVQGGAVKAHIPLRYGRRVEQGTAGLRLTGNPTA